MFFLKTPAECREFIEGLRSRDGAKVEYVGLENGKDLYFKDMTDAQYVHYAMVVAKMLGLTRPMPKKKA